jgi:hypothetical protein
MNLALSPCCHHLCFSNVSACPWCGQAFESGELERIAVAEEKSFKTKSYAMFLGVFVVSLVLLRFIQLQS